jgi:ribosomal-protein-alanine N-acetyltransferase
MTSQHQILPFDAADPTPLAALHALSFAKSWDAAAIAALLATPGAFAFHHSHGFVLARVAGEEAEILTLAVMPEKRGQGLGRALLQAAITQAQELGAQTVFLEAGADNPSALALYARLGFTKVGMRKGYYNSASGGTDALVLRLPLPMKFA